MLIRPPEIYVAAGHSSQNIFFILPSEIDWVLIGSENFERGRVKKAIVLGKYLLLGTSFSYINFV